MNWDYSHFHVGWTTSDDEASSDPSSESGTHQLAWFDRSVVTDDDLHQLSKKYGILKTVSLRVPQPGESIDRPLLGEVVSYLAMFRFCVRL